MRYRIDSIKPPPMTRAHGQARRPADWLVLIGGPGETSAEDIEAFFADMWPDVGDENSATTSAAPVRDEVQPVGLQPEGRHLAEDTGSSGKSSA